MTIGKTEGGVSATLIIKKDNRGIKKRGVKMRNAEEREKRRNQIREEILSSKEAIEILGLSRMRLSQIVNDGRIIPIRKGIYLKDDIIAFKKSRE